MEIKTVMQNIQKNTVQTNQVSTSASSAEKIKLAVEMLEQGQMVKGQVLDVKNMVAKILTQSGETINGKLQSPNQLNIGEERNFIVSKDDKGNTMFSIVKENDEVLLKNNLSKALNDLGIKSDEKNINLAKSLIKGEFPINKETLQNLSRGVSLFAGDNKAMDKALFMLKNEMPINSKNANILNNFVSKEMKSLDNVKNMETAINNLADPKLKDAIIKILNGNSNIAQTQNSPAMAKEVVLAQGQEKAVTQEKVAMQEKAVVQETPATHIEETQSKLKNETTQASLTKNEVDITKQPPEKLEKEILNLTKNLMEKDTLLQKNNGILEELAKTDKNILPEKLNLKFQLKNGDPKELDNFIESTKQRIDTAIRELTSSKAVGSEKLMEQLINAKDKLEFTQFMKNNVYMEIPLNVNNHQTNGELLVFKDKKGKSGKNGKATSAIIGIDTANLGRFETYIKKDNQKVNLQFRLENDDVVNLVKSNMSKLESLLESYNINIESVSFKKIDNSFTIMTNEDQDEKIDSSKLMNIKFDIRM